MNCTDGMVEWQVFVLVFNTLIVLYLPYSVSTYVPYIATYNTHTHGTYWSNELWHVQYLQYTLIGCCFQCRSPYCTKTENLEDLCYTL